MVWVCLAKKKTMIGWSMEYELEGARPRGRPKRTWRGVVQKDCQARKLNREYAMDHSRWRKLIKMVDDQDGCEWGMFLLVPTHPDSTGQRALKWLRFGMLHASELENG